MADQNTQSASPARPSFRNAPRFVNIPPFPANAALYASVVALLGGPAAGRDRLIAFARAFVKRRYEVTGWRLIRDISSRDTKHAAARPNTPATENLDVPFPSFTVTLAAKVEEISKNEIKMTRNDSLGVMAQLREELKSISEPGLKIWDHYNTTFGYQTLGMSAASDGAIPDDAREHAASFEL